MKMNAENAKKAFNQLFSNSNFIHQFDLNSIDFERFQLYMPKLKDAVVPLSFTGVSPRNFHAWKENGLIELSIHENEEDKNKKVKLNLTEFVWVKMIQAMRNFGLPYDMIRQLKYLLYSDIIELFRGSWDLVEQELINLNFDEEQMLAARITFDEVVSGMDSLRANIDMTESEKTMLFALVLMVIFTGATMAVLIEKTEFEVKLGITSYNKVEMIHKASLPTLLKPHFQIPITGIINDFFNEPQSEKYAEKFGFLNAKELKVLEAVRKKDFLEINIKLDKTNEINIDVVKDGTITDEQANKIRKILGLNQYEEVLVKYRNDKNLYFRNKKRIQ
ncbi:MAG: hypothetical protein V4538_00805 [Bacteroidota bacterium]